MFHQPPETNCYEALFPWRAFYDCWTNFPLNSLLLQLILARALKGQPWMMIFKFRQASIIYEILQTISPQPLTISFIWVLKDNADLKRNNIIRFIDIPLLTILQFYFLKFEGCSTLNISNYSNNRLSNVSNCNLSTSIQKGH